MSYREHKIILGLQPEIYRAGLLSVLNSRYKVFPLPMRFGPPKPPTIIQEDLVDSDCADLAIIGFGLDDAEDSLRISTLVQASGIKIMAILFDDDSYLLRKVLDINPLALLHHETPSRVIEKAVEQTLKGNQFVDERLAESLFYLAKDKEASVIENLTLREKKVLEFIVQGLSNKEIASKRSLSERTIKYYCQRIYQKTGVRNRIELICLVNKEASPF